MYALLVVSVLAPRSCRWPACACGPAWRGGGGRSPPVLAAPSSPSASASTRSRTPRTGRIARTARARSFGTCPPRTGTPAPPPRQPSGSPGSRWSRFRYSPAWSGGGRLPASGVAGNVGGVDGERNPSDARTQGAPMLEKYWCDREQRSSRKALPCDVRERSATQQIADAVCSRQPVKAPALTGPASSLLLKQAARAANVAGHITSPAARWQRFSPSSAPASGHARDAHEEPPEQRRQGDRRGREGDQERPRPFRTAFGRSRLHPATVGGAGNDDVSAEWRALDAGLLSRPVQRERLPPGAVHTKPRPGRGPGSAGTRPHAVGGGVPRNPATIARMFHRSMPIYVAPGEPGGPSVSPYRFA